MPSGKYASLWKIPMRVAIDGIHARLAARRIGWGMAGEEVEEHATEEKGGNSEHRRGKQERFGLVMLVFVMVIERQCMGHRALGEEDRVVVQIYDAWARRV